MKPIFFIGDSITAYWQLADYFACVVNKGVAGQTPAQVKARFADDVLALDPHGVVILCGTNDPYPSAVPDVIDMAESARAAGIQVVLGLIPPRAWDISGFNKALAIEAADREFNLVNYYNPMCFDDGSQNTALFSDGTHPNAAGYDVMAKALSPLLEATQRYPLFDVGPKLSPAQTACAFSIVEA